MLRALVYIVPIALLIYALIDFSRSLPSERADIPAPAWVLMIVLLPVVGPLAWVLVSRSRRSGDPMPSHTGPARLPQGGPPTRAVPPRPTAPRRRPGSKAPDDDPEFLWRLEQQQRRQTQRDRRRTDPPGDQPRPERSRPDHPRPDTPDGPGAGRSGSSRPSGEDPGSDEPAG